MKRESEPRTTVRLEERLGHAEEVRGSGGTIRASGATSASPTRLALPLEARRRIVAEATRRFPAEACGLLVGRPPGAGDPAAPGTDERGKAARTEVVRVVSARNRATASNRYDLHPEDFLAADEQARAESLEIVGIWHSHPEHPAVPSTTDVDAAWPGYSYVIVSIHSGEPSAIRSWRIVDGQFREESLED